MTPEAFEELLTRYCHGQCTSQEEAFVLEWYNTIDTTRRQALPEEQRIILEAKAWAQLSARLRKDRGPRYSLRLRVAASLALVVLAGVGWYVFRAGPVQVARVTPATLPAGWLAEVNHAAIPRTIMLPDSSTVILKPGSHVCFPQIFDVARRELTLMGEAFFDVQRDTLRPFLVYTREVTTRVLGTSFTIKAYAHDPEIAVAVATGRVAVYAQPADTRQDAAPVILSPNQQAVYNRRKEHVIKALVAHPRVVTPMPQNPAMLYEAAPVATILDALSASYGVALVYDETTVAGCTLTTSLTDEDLYARIRIVCEAIGARFVVQDTTIVITGSGCP